MSDPVPYDPEKHHRRSIRLADYDYSQPGAYFITICTQDKVCLFGKVIDGEMHLNAFGWIVDEEWQKTAQVRSNVLLDEFVVMPNHVHGIIRIIEDLATGTADRAQNVVGATRRVAPTKRPTGPPSGSVGAIMAQFKSLVTKRINRLRGTPGAKVWQRNYWERVVRNEQELDRIRRYIEENPLRWYFDRYHPDK